MEHNFIKINFFFKHTHSQRRNEKVVRVWARASN